MEATDLRSFHAIVVNSSGGKDSQTALRKTVSLCDAAGVPRSRITVAHQDLGQVEWPGTVELVHRQADCYGLEVRVSRYRSAEGEEFDLLEYARRRGKWPGPKQRYCTSEFKRGPGGRIITEIVRELRPTIPRPRVLNVYGIRSEESPARSKLRPLALNERLTSGTREVWDYYPIFAMTEEAVWKDIRASGVPYHRAYDLGMPRLSCAFCFYAPRAALLIAGRENRALLDAYCDVEQEIGHEFMHNQPIREIREAIRSGEVPEAVASWVM